MTVTGWVEDPNILGNIVCCWMARWCPLPVAVSSPPRSRSALSELLPRMLFAQAALRPELLLRFNAPSPGPVTLNQVAFIVRSERNQRQISPTALFIGQASPASIGPASRAAPPLDGSSRPSAVQNAALLPVADPTLAEAPRAVVQSDGGAAPGATRCPLSDGANSPQVFPVALSGGVLTLPVEFCLDQLPPDHYTGRQHFYG